MEQISRRSFIGAGAGLSAAVLAAQVAPAQADITPDMMANGLDDLDVRQFRKELIDSKGEYVREDGSVVPAVYVKLRALINTIGMGCGNDVRDTGFDEYMYLFTEEEAQEYLDMPLSGEFFTAVEYSVVSGRPEAECEEICEKFANRGLLFRARRGGVPYYHMLAEAHGIWEYNLLRISAEQGGGLENFCTDEVVAEYTTHHNGLWGTDGIGAAETPFYYAVPVSKDVVEGGEILPYDDFEAILARNTKFAVSPCQCRLSHEATGQRIPEGGETHPLETCLSIGEMAEFYIENGIGRELTREEALAVLQRSIDAGMVIQSAYSKDSEIFCSCHGDCCDILRGIAALRIGKDFGKRSHYHLVHDEEACIKCGICVGRCPLFAISMDEETGFPVLNEACMGCGQCGLACPAGARMLHKKDDSEIFELPQNMLEDYQLKTLDRITQGLVY